MTQNSELITQNIHEYLKQHQHKSLLRFITCGSVDDGKSTLIGRLLYDSKMIFADQLKALESDSIKMGTQGDKIDFALLVDGLAAEREQGITIDVAYRYFSTDQRKFIVADTPGHEQYTRNMITGASTAELAIVLVDATKGIVTQTKRHSYLASIMGIQEVVLAINKMDLVNYSSETYEKIVNDYIVFANQINLKKITPIPISALEGDNIKKRSIYMTWYKGPTLLEHLETVSPAHTPSTTNFRLPIQWVNRPNSSFRGYAGTIISGEINCGDEIYVSPSQKISKIKKIITKDASLDKALTGQAITITLENEIDISRGDVISKKDSPPTIGNQFEAKIIWLSDDPLHPNRQYLLKCATKTVNASITKIKYLININTLEHAAANFLELNSISVCNVHTDQKFVFDRFSDNPVLGSFILIDKENNHTVGAGLIDFELNRSQNIVPQNFKITKLERALIKNQQPKVLWFTGLSGSGKSTIANLVEEKLHSSGKHCYILDGDNIRHGLNKDLGFTKSDRIENIRRISEVAKLMTDAGLIVLVTFISPFQKDRDFAKSLFETDEFLEIYISTPLGVAEKRDPKGLYKKAREGLIKNFTGINSPYEIPTNPNLTIDTEKNTPQECAELVVSLLNDS